jgi:hypothetical protein
MTADGKRFTVTAVLSVSVQPLELVTVTVYVPLVVTDIAEVVAEVDHKYPVPPEAVSTTDPPWQKVVGPPAVMTADGNGFTVTDKLSVSAQPVELVTVTIYVPLVVTVIAEVMAEVDHKYPVPPEAVSTTYPPWQKVVDPLAAMTADGNGFTITAALSVSAQPPILVTVTI